MDPFWTHLLSGAGGGALVTAIMAGYLSIVKERNKNNREKRADEVDVLQKSIEGLRADLTEAKAEATAQVAEAKAEVKASRKEILKLKDDHTECLVKYGQMQKEVEAKDREIAHLKEEVQSLTNRIEHLEARVPLEEK